MIAILQDRVSASAWRVIKVGVPPPPTAPTASHTDPTTCANPTGTITVTAPLGTGLSYRPEELHDRHPTGPRKRVCMARDKSRSTATAGSTNSKSHRSYALR